MWDATGFTALPKPEPLTSVNAGSALLPTPVAGNFNDGESLASWEARRQKNYAKRINGNGQGTPLPIALLKLLPTPRASDGPHGGPQQTGTGLVPIITKLFPTSTEACGKGGQVSRSGARKGEKLLNDPVQQLFPTPTFTDSKGSRNQTANRSPGSRHHSGTTLTDAVTTLFPTPAD